MEYDDLFELNKETRQRPANTLPIRNLGEANALFPEEFLRDSTYMVGPVQRIAKWNDLEEDGGDNRQFFRFDHEVDAIETTTMNQKVKPQRIVYGIDFVDISKSDRDKIYGIQPGTRIRLGGSNGKIEVSEVLSHASQGAPLQQSASASGQQLAGIAETAKSREKESSKIGKLFKGLLPGKRGGGSRDR